jgi:hypothetical protein
MMSASSKRVSFAELVDVLERSVGRERAEELVTAVIAELGLRADQLSPAAAAQVLERLARGTDVVAVAARFGLSRAWFGEREAPPPPSSGARESTRRAFSVETLGELLAPTVGREKAVSSIGSAVAALGLGVAFDRASALAVLERVAEEPGLVGVAARFAKVKLHLNE